MKVKFKDKQGGLFCGKEVNMERVPCVGEYVMVDNCNKYKVTEVITQFVAWKQEYIVTLDR